MIKSNRIPWNLIIPKLKGEVSAEEKRKLEEWLRSSNNEDLFHELEMLWDKIQSNVADYSPDTEYYWNELKKRMDKSTNNVALSVPLKAKKASIINKMYKYAAAASIVVALGCSFYLGFMNGMPVDNMLVYSNISGKSRVELPDGTEVWLHSKTDICYDASMKGDERLVDVDGEAFFDVEHDKDKPFVVRTDGLRIVVHGTKFNVDACSSEDNVFVSLLEGSVSLETVADRQYLHPGETATFNKKNHSIMISKDDVGYMSSWASNQIVFQNSSLKEVCRMLSKWYNVRIDLDPQISEKFHYTFTVKNETLEEILRMMNRVQPLKYTFDENKLSISVLE